MTLILATKEPKADKVKINAADPRVDVKPSDLTRLVKQAGEEARGELGRLGHLATAEDVWDTFKRLLVKKVRSRAAPRSGFGGTPTEGVLHSSHTPVTVRGRVQASHARRHGACEGH